MRASGAGVGQREERTELPAAVTASQAKRLVEQGLARQLAAAQLIKVSLPPARMAIGPGDAIHLPGKLAPLIVEALTLDGLAVELRARPASSVVPGLPADAGRHVEEPDVAIGRTEMALFELPAMGPAEEDQASICLAGSNHGRWKPVPVEVKLGTELFPSQLLSRRAILGHAISGLPGRTPLIVDNLSEVIVQLVNADEHLLNADFDALAMGANLALLGSELLQFGRAENLGDGLFRLTGLLRGCFGTEWATDMHAIGETFLVVERTAISKATLPPGVVGAHVRARAMGIGDIAPQHSAECTVSGEAMWPLSPCHLQLRRECNTLHVNWAGRSRRNWAWSDEIDDDDALNVKRFRVSLSGPGGSVEVETPARSVAFDLEAIAAESGEVVTVSVSTVGLRALSRPRNTSFTL